MMMDDFGSMILERMRRDDVFIHPVNLLWIEI